ncbi:hypothetical protein SY88_21405 [Clostridiales bacterium PH28_bin88]|nr:hypothetical protein SY88_21405 [Clostridiales bacterium PH28_bin88]
MGFGPAEFVTSAVKPGQYPQDGLPEIALVGRSNVGKSSLINTVTGRRGLARISSSPGRTQTINFFRVGGEWYLVDLPGYGFARVPREVKEAWGRMIERYLAGRTFLRAVVQLVDLRHPPSDQDVEMYRWLAHFQLPVIVVATKADKVSKGRQQHHLQVVRRILELPSGAQVVPFSAVTGQGKETLAAAIREVLGLPF